jgi:hypothetical protein
MGDIVLITHEFDRLTRPRIFGAPVDGYMICGILEEMRRRGHRWVWSRGLSARPRGDLAILHVDATRTPPEYQEYGRTFPFCLNVDVTDISKHAVSDAIVADDGWQGPVIVKTDLNHCGLPEARLNRRARLRWKKPPFPDVKTMLEYRVFDRLSDVPMNVLSDPNLVVERFLPEPEIDGYALSNWVFCGEYDFCGRFVSRKRLVKGADVFRHELSSVPDELRRKRKEMGFDLGKFDFAVHEGRPILLDANRTPGIIPPGGASLKGLADGLEGIIRRLR